MPGTSAEETRIAVVTGAGTGVGRGIALELARLGWSVALGGRRVERLEETAADIADTPGRAFVHSLDVGDAASVEAFFEAVEAALGPVDALVNNAGMALPAALHETPPEDIERVFRTNTVGALYCTRRAIRAMIDGQRPGDVVFISSDTAEIPVPRNAIYGATKAALENASRAFNVELEGTGVRCTVVRLGPTLSEFGFGWDPSLAQGLLEYWNRFHFYHGGTLEPADVGRAVVAAITADPRVHIDTVWVRPNAPTGDVAGARVVRPEDLEA